MLHFARQPHASTDLEPGSFAFYLRAAVTIANQQQDSIGGKGCERTHQVQNRLSFPGPGIILMSSHREAADTQDNRPLFW